MFVIASNIILYLSFSIASGVLFYRVKTKDNRIALNMHMKRWVPYVWFILFVTMIIINPVKIPTSFQEWKWVLTYTTYFTASSFWFGAVLVTNYLMKRHTDWERLFKSYSKLIMSSMLITLIAGIIMIPMESSSYIGALGMSYGQLLLVNHILMIGLIVYTSANLLWINRQLKTNTAFDPLRRLRGEGGWALLIIIVTGILRGQPLPRNVEVTVYFNDLSFIFRQIFQISNEQTYAVTWATSSIGILLLVLSIAVLIVYLFFYRVHVKALYSFFIFIIAGVGLYSGVMLSLELSELIELSESTKQIILALGSAAFCH